MDDKKYMQIAINEAKKAEERGEVPIGAVVVYDPIDPATRKHLFTPRIIAQAGNCRENMQDASGHAEFVAMREAMKELSAWRLTGCTVYVTLEPCIMCAGLMQQARVSRCVYGACDPKGGALGSLYSIHNDDRLNHSFEVVSGVMQEECSQLLKDFFRKKRKK